MTCYAEMLATASQECPLPLRPKRPNFCPAATKPQELSAAAVAAAAATADFLFVIQVSTWTSHRTLHQAKPALPDPAFDSPKIRLVSSAFLLASASMAIAVNLMSTTALFKSHALFDLIGLI